MFAKNVAGYAVKVERRIARYKKVQVPAFFG